MQVHIVEVVAHGSRIRFMYYAILAKESDSAVGMIRKSLAFGDDVRTVDPLPWMGELGALDLQPGKPRLLSPPEELDHDCPVT